jgi:hypothetical protein
VKFSFKSQITEITYDGSNQIEEYKGEVEATHRDAAYEEAKHLSWGRARTIQNERGGSIGYRNVTVKAAKQEA